jgi:hypothetical protein
MKIYERNITLRKIESKFGHGFVRLHSFILGLLYEYISYVT